MEQRQKKKVVDKLSLLSQGFYGSPLSTVRPLKTLPFIEYLKIQGQKGDIRWISVRNREVQVLVERDELGVY
jgi:hypothetical protein